MSQTALSPDWLPQGGEMARRIREVDWVAAGLGPITAWPLNLRNMVALTLGSPVAAILLWGPDHIQIYNDRWRSLMGGKHPAALGQPTHDCFPEIAAQMAPLFAQVRRGEPVVMKETLLPIRRNREVEDAWWDVHYLPVRDEGGDVAGIFCTVVEATARVLQARELKAMEGRQAVLQRLRDLLAPVADPVEAARRAMDLLGEVLGVDRASFFRAEEADNGWVHVVGEDHFRKAGMPSRAGARAHADFGKALLAPLAEGEPVVVSDVETVESLTPAQQENFRAARLRAFIVAPVVRNGRYVAGISVHASAPRRWTAEEVALVGDMADRAWEAIGHATAEAERRESEAKYRALFDAVDAGLAIFDMIFDAAGAPVDFRYVETNRAFAVQTGRDPQPGQTMSETFPEAYDLWLGLYGRVARTGRAERFTDYVEGLDRWFEVVVFPFSHGGRTRLAALFTDVTERRQAEQMQRDSERLQAAMLDVLPLGVGLMNRDGEVVLSNLQWARFVPTQILPSRDPDRRSRWRSWDAEGRLVEPENYPGARALRGERVDPAVEFLYREDDGRELWTSIAAVPIFDADGQVTGAASIVQDIDAAKRAQAALREGEERLRRFGEASQDILWLRDAETLQWQYLTPAFETIYGLSRQDALTGDNFRNWLELVVPEDRAVAIDNIRRVRQGQQAVFEYRIRRPSDGEIRWLRDTDFPIMDEAGKVVLIGGIGEDVTEAKLGRERLEQSEERLRSAVEVGKLGLWDWDVPTGEVHWSDEHFTLEGYAVGEVKPSYEAWAARLHPDDRAGVEGALRSAMDRHEEFVSTFRVVHPDGSIHWLSGRGRFFYDAEDRPLRMIGAMIDVTEPREWEERQKVLVAELQHRTRNLLGVVRSVSEKTVRASADLAEFRERFRDRLEALSRVQGLLSRMKDHDRVTFDELIRAEFDAVAAGDERVVLRGPAGIRLRSSTVQTIAMAMHELATNAVKYGALTQPTAQLAVAWSFEPTGDGGKPWMHIEWRESGVAMPSPGAPARGAGQGRELIEKALPYQLGARTSYRLGPDGVHCTVSVPVSAGAGE